MTATATSSSCSSRRCRGFTLLEVMVALAVVAIAFVGLLGLHGRNIQLVDRANHYSRAVLLAREMMAQLQFQESATIDDGSGTFESYPEFHWERVVEPGPFESIKLVRVRVFWDERNKSACELVYFVGQRDE